MSYYYYLLVIENARTTAAALDALRAAACIPTISPADFARLYKAATDRIKAIQRTPAGLTA